MCKAPNIPAPPPIPQAEKTPISLPNKRKRGTPGTADYIGSSKSLLAAPAATNSTNTLLGQ
jgi:hypothetical protein